MQYNEISKKLNELKEIEIRPISYITSHIVSAFKSLALLLFIIFFALYLTDKIDWSLWLVTLPIWYGIPIYLIALFCDWIRYLIKNKKK